MAEDTGYDLLHLTFSIFSPFSFLSDLYVYFFPAIHDAISNPFGEVLLNEK